MGNTLMSLLVKLGVDNTDLDKGLGDAEKKAGGFASNVTSRMSNIGMGIAAGITAAAGATVAVLASTIKPASDLGESINAVNVVFEDGADIIKAYGENAAMTVGLSNREFNQLSSVTGAFLTNLGYDSQEAADQTIVLTERAADLASVFNTDVGTALQAIQSGLKGEFNPLEQFGVKMNAAAIETYALTNGLAKSKDELTDSVKAQAALAMFMEQTDKVAGDFTNTSDGMANSQRQLSAMFEDLKAKVGKGLLKAVEALAKTFKDIASSPEFQAWLDGVIEGVANLGAWLAESIPLVIEKFKALGAWFSENQGVVVAILAIMGAALLAFAVTSAIAAVTALAPWLPVIAVLALIGAAAYLIYKAWTTNFGGIQEKVAAFVAFVKPIFENFINSLVTLWQTVLLPAIKAVWEWMNSVLFPFLKELGDFLGAVFGKAWEALGALWTNVLLPAIQEFIGWVKENVMPILEPFAAFIGDKLSGAFDGLSSALKSAGEWLGKMADKINALSLPDWLTPGSPTPFELGLLGIHDALQKVASGGLPMLETGLQLSPVGISGVTTPAPADGGGSSGGTGRVTLDEMSIDKLITRLETALQRLT